MKKLLSSLLGLVLFGCGADPGYEPRASPHVVISGPQSHTSASPEAPRETTAALQVCVDRYGKRLSAESYGILFDIRATESGQVTAVKINDSMLEGSDVERCLVDVLEHMAVPAAVTNMQRSSAVSPQSRSLPGVVQAAAAPIALLPIVLVAGGVTILVGVTIHVIAHAIDDVKAEKERCKQVKEGCIEYCSDAVLDQGFHEPLFSRCLRACMEKANCW